MAPEQFAKGAIKNLWKRPTRVTYIFRILVGLLRLICFWNKISTTKPTLLFCRFLAILRNWERLEPISKESCICFPANTHFRKSDVVWIFSLLFFRYCSQTCDGENNWEKTRQQKKSCLQMHFTKSQNKTQKRFLFLSHIVKSQEVMQKARHFRLFFLKSLKEDSTNSITLEVAISKNKRARHVVENNRFVLAGMYNGNARSNAMRHCTFLKFT